MTTWRVRRVSAWASGLVLLAACLSSSNFAGAQQDVSAGAAGHGDHGMSVAQTAPPGQRTPAPPDAYCYIGWPNDGEVVRTNRIKVWFGTRDFGVAPAGVTKPNTGHHHLLIDAPLPKLDEAIPNDKNHLHFGLGQTETIIELPPGTHTLQLLMGDADHVPHDPPVMSKRITIHVKAGPAVAERR
jgi:hypothetical protein